MIPSLLATAASAVPAPVSPGDIQLAIDTCTSPCAFVLGAEAYPDHFVVPGGASVTIDASTATLSGSIVVDDSASLVLTGPTFAGNTITPVIRVDGGSLALSGAIATGLVSPSTGLLEVNGATSVVNLVGGAVTGIVGNAGAAILVNDGAVLIEGTAFSENTATDGDGGALLINAGQVWILQATTFSLNGALGSGGAIAQRGGSLTVEGATFTTNFAAMGSAIDTDAGTLSVANSWFVENGQYVNAGTGGAIRVSHRPPLAPPVATLEGSTFLGNLVQFVGGAIAAESAPLVVRDCTFGQNRAFASGGGAIYASGGAIEVTGCSFQQDDTDGAGGALYLLRADATVSDSRFDGTSAGRGGAVALEEVVDAQLQRNAFCGTTATSGGAIDVLQGTATLANSVFAGQRAQSGGVLVVDGADVTAGQLTILDAGGAGGSIAATTNAASLTLSGSIVDLAVEPAFSVAPGTGVTLDGVVFDDPMGDYGDVDPAGILEVPVQWLAAVSRPTHPLQQCPPYEHRIHPNAAQFAAYPAPNGGLVDYGAFGGLDGSAPSPWVDDQDQDSVPWIYDCDDLDPLVHGLAVERCNGADDDCDAAIDEPAAGWSLDLDGDGFGGPEAVDCLPEGVPAVPYDADRVDCDDDDAAVHPAAVEVPNDGVDQDCDGADGPPITTPTPPPDTGTAPTAPTAPTSPDPAVGTRLAAGRCGCASPEAPALPLALVPVLLLRRRQRSQQWFTEPQVWSSTQADA